MVDRIYYEIRFLNNTNNMLLIDLRVLVIRRWIYV